MKNKREDKRRVTFKKSWEKRGMGNQINQKIERRCKK